MLSIGKIEQYVETAKSKFIEMYPEEGIIPPIIVCSERRRWELRNKTLRECGLAYKEDDFGTIAEVISGPIATKIILYQARIGRIDMVFHCIWHELGHLLFGNEKDFNINLDIDSPLRSGYAVFNEFIAEYIAYTVNENLPLYGLLPPNKYLCDAFQEPRQIIPYWLSLYYAVILGEENAFDAYFDEGEALLSPIVWKCVVKIMRMLFDQTDKEEFWRVDTNYLETLGILYDELYHTVFCNCAFRE